MARARSPVAKSEVTGAMLKNPQRYTDRKKVKSNGLGEPSNFLKTEHEKAAWEAFKRELPWLTEAHRSMVELCSKMRGSLLAGEDMGINAISRYQAMLSKLGATPADESKVNYSPPDEGEEDDIFDA